MYDLNHSLWRSWMESVKYRLATVEDSNE